MTMCNDCQREWNGAAECHCAGCHQHFTSETPFTKHQPKGKCLTPTEMAKARTPEAENPIFSITQRKDGSAWTSWKKDERHD